MSDDTFNIREQAARIDRAQAELTKMNAETRKFVAEAGKLSAEADKLRRDRFLAPAVALAATLGAIAIYAPAIFKALGGHG